MWLLESGGTGWELRPLGEECALRQSVACRQGAGVTDILTFCFLPSSLVLVLPPGQTHPEPEGKEVQPVQPRGSAVHVGGGGGGGGEEECGDWLVRKFRAGGPPAPRLRPLPSFPVSACKPYQTPSPDSNATTLVKPSTVPSVGMKWFLPVLSSQAVPSAGPP